jgi:hypothetical protein
MSYPLFVEKLVQERVHKFLNSFIKPTKQILGNSNALEIKCLLGSPSQEE